VSGASALNMSEARIPGRRAADGHQEHKNKEDSVIAGG